jgi:hypothetical protein
MSVETDPNSYKSKDVELLRGIVASAEKRLEAQLTAALAADQRALVLAGFLITVIVALIGASAALLLTGHGHLGLATTALVCAVLFLVALGLTVFAARPAEWNYPGTRPELWRKDIAAKKDEDLRLAELCADLQRKIGENAGLMSRNGALIVMALSIVGMALLIGGLAVASFVV